MGLMSWLKRALGGKADSAELSFAEGENDLDGLDMKGAIDAHMKWRTRLEDYINGTSQEQLEAATVARDDCCVLGKWIYGTGQKNFGSMSEYEELKKVHAQFHLGAGNVLLEHTRSGKDAAIGLLRGSEFRYNSDRVQLAVVRLYAKAKNLS